MTTQLNTHMITVAATGEHIQLDSTRTLVAGYTGRDKAAVQHHIDELAAIGVTPPTHVPMFYPMDTISVTTAPVVAVSSSATSGEVEPLLVRIGGRSYLGLGSDHTDRALETIDIGDSKQACAKPIADTVIEVTDWEQFDWDACRVRSWVDGTLYQEGSLAGLRTPTELLGILAQRLGDDGGDLLCFAGTLPLLDGTFVYGHRWDLELTTADGATLTHTYTTEISEGQEH